MSSLKLREIQNLYNISVNENLSYNSFATLRTNKGKLLSVDAFIRVEKHKRLAKIFDRWYEERLKSIADEIKNANATLVFPIYLYEYKKLPTTLA